MSLEPQSSQSFADRKDAIERAVGAIEKQFGKGAIMRLNDSSHREKIEATSTGSLSLDIAIGIGGIPRGRIVEIFGPESSGKTTLTLHMVAEVQKAGGVAAFIDAEHALDVNYAKKIGVDLDTLLVSQPDTGEQALEIADTLVRSEAVDLIIIDSVAALTPKAEIEGEMGDQHMGLQARLMSQALRKLTGTISRTKCSVVFINQIRMKIGVMFGSPETTTGGNALKFYASLRLDIRRIATVKVGEDAIGNRVRVKVVKNKVAPPFKQVEFDLLFASGICKMGEVVDLGVEKNIIQKSGAWFSYNGERLGQGREAVKTFLTENKAVEQEIETAIKRSYGLISTPEVVETNKDANAKNRDAKEAKTAPDKEKEDAQASKKKVALPTPPVSPGSKAGKSSDSAVH